MIEFTAVNTGERKAVGASVLVDGEKVVTPTTVELGDLAPGESVRRSTHVTIDEPGAEMVLLSNYGAPGGVATLTVGPEANEGRGSALNIVGIVVGVALALLGLLWRWRSRPEAGPPPP
ncbi:MAG: hypothetical protein KJ006_04140 [Thermoleophilia bacterium]|nr:hypothetical protein [Thermoleophilia bacterium]